MTRRLKLASAGEKGLGVFAVDPIEAGEVIEVARVIVETCSMLADGSNLDRYVYQWGDGGERCAIVLGHGSLYNHSYRPNAMFVADLEHETMTYCARRSIAAGEEITVNYNGDPLCMDDVGFPCESAAE
jgi:SET domain-containing protein